LFLGIWRALMLIGVAIVMLSLLGGALFLIEVSRVLSATAHTSLHWVRSEIALCGYFLPPLPLL